MARKKKQHQHQHQQQHRKGVGGHTMKLSTDPQSVAARLRRHRISGRFKILQSLVPGGSKMDIVSMLEEAIHYVNFLKTHITWLHRQHEAINIHHYHGPTLTANYDSIFPPTYNLSNYSYVCPLPPPNYNHTHQQPRLHDWFGNLIFPAARISQVAMDDEELEAHIDLLSNY